MLFVADSAKERIIEVLNSENKSLTEYFVRVSVTSGGCSGLSYKLDFDNDLKPTDQVFEDKGIRIPFLSFQVDSRVRDSTSAILMHRGLVHAEKVFQSKLTITIFRLVL